MMFNLLPLELNLTIISYLRSFTDIDNFINIILPFYGKTGTDVYKLLLIMEYPEQFREIRSIEMTDQNCALRALFP